MNPDVSSATETADEGKKLIIACWYEFYVKWKTIRYNLQRRFCWKTPKLVTHTLLVVGPTCASPHIPDMLYIQACLSKPSLDFGRKGI